LLGHRADGRKTSPNAVIAEILKMLRRSLCLSFSTLRVYATHNLWNAVLDTPTIDQVNFRMLARDSTRLPIPMIGISARSRRQAWHQSYLLSRRAKGGREGRPNRVDSAAHKFVKRSGTPDVSDIVNQALVTERAYGDSYAG